MALPTLISSIFGRSSQSIGTLAAVVVPSLATSDVAPDVRRLVRQRQYCKILAKSAELPFDELSRTLARQTLEQEMALVPPGSVGLASLTPGNAIRQTEVNALYIDRFCVTNADFLQFVHSGGYEETKFWPESILTEVLSFRDSSGAAGPRFWIDGKPLKGREDHPVVGISWFEANAYAQWAGKRLPTPAQWQRAGSWGKSVGVNEARYPWGNAFLHSNANIWSSRIGDTVSVREFSVGSTPNGVFQLIGNTWEWLNAQFALPNSSYISEEGTPLLAEIRGGAFDTYFASQVTCQFRSGQPLLTRAPNISFRCSIECEQLIDSISESETSHVNSGAP